LTPGGTSTGTPSKFSVGVGEYEGVVRVSRRVFQMLLPEAPTPEHCLEAYHLHRTRLELIAAPAMRLADVVARHRTAKKPSRGASRVLTAARRARCQIGLARLSRKPLTLLSLW